MSDKPIKVVVVGCGSMSNAWVKISINSERIELVGLVDLHRAAAEKMAERHGQPASMVYDSLADAVKATSPDAVFDVTVPVAHDKVTLEALELGCHVLGEKPMTDDLDKAKKMVAKAKEAGKLYAVTQTRRPNMGAQTAARMVQGGKIGQLAEVHCDFFIGARFGGDARDNFRNTMAHPLILDMAIHTFDSARQISGCDPVSVYCHASNPGHSWYDGDASATAIFEMKTPDGKPVVYTYRGSWTNHGLQTSWNADWRFAGADGSLKWDGGDGVTSETIQTRENDEMFYGLDTTHYNVPKPKLDGHAFMLDNFAQAIQSGDHSGVFCPCEDNIKSLAMVLAAVKSAESGQKVAVEY